MRDNVFLRMEVKTVERDLLSVELLVLLLQNREFEIW